MVETYEVKESESIAFEPATTETATKEAEAIPTEGPKAAEVLTTEDADTVATEDMKLPKTTEVAAKEAEAKPTNAV